MKFIVIFPLWLVLLLLPFIIVAKLFIAIVRLAWWAIVRALRTWRSVGTHGRN